MIQTAEGALNETHSILQRSRELAVQASNETYNTDDIAAIQKEIDSLLEEVDNISTNTKFNDKALLDGTLDVDLAIGAETEVLNVAIAAALDSATLGTTTKLAEFKTGGGNELIADGA